MALAFGDGVLVRDGHTTLGDPRHQGHLWAKGHATQTTAVNTARRTLTAHVAARADGKLHRGMAAAGQAPKHVFAVGALGEFGNQVAHIGGLAIGVHQGGVGLKTHVLAQRRHATEHPVLVVRQLAQHHRQGGLVKVLDVVACNAHTHRARPIGDGGQFGAQPIQDVLGLVGIVVGDVNQAQGGLRCMGGQTQLRFELGQHQASRHRPLRVGGMGTGKQLHGRLVVARLRAAGRLLAGLVPAALAAWAGAALPAMSMPAALACCCMSLMVFWAMS